MALGDKATIVLLNMQNGYPQTVDECDIALKDLEALQAACRMFDKAGTGYNTDQIVKMFEKYRDLQAENAKAEANVDVLLDALEGLVNRLDIHFSGPSKSEDWQEQADARRPSRRCD